jgi:hypothetical protein
MDKIKQFFAQDWVKIVAAGLFVIVSGLLTQIPEGPTKTVALQLWSLVITPLAISWGIVSGGTSSQRSNASVAVTATLVEKGVIPPKG